MSFNARLPSNSSASHRGRPYGNRRRPARGGLVKSEDAQPNELLNKRNVSGPPVIRTSGPLPRDRGRGAPAFSGGRGHIPQPTGSNAPYANSRLNGYRGNRGNSSQMRARPYPYHADSTEPWSRLSHGPNLNVPPPSGSHASSGTPQQFGYSGYAALPRAERWTAPESSTDEHGPHAASEDSRDSARISQHRVDDQSGSNFSSQGTLWRPRPPATVSSRTLPPLPRSQFHPFSRREAPPHMGGAGSSSIATTAPWMHDPATHFMPGEPSSVDASRGIHITGTTSHVAAPAGYIQAPTELNGIAQAPASALASLLPDRAQSWPSSTSTMTSRSNPPPLKRRKLSPINATSTLSSPRPEMPPLPTLTNTASTSIIPEPQRTVNPQPTEITSASPTVKRERSPSPTIDDASARLVAEGCVRVAPLPPECKATRPGYKAARQAWTAKEVKKLRDLGLQPTRVFVREDGMVIDWKSKLPVMSDTLRPPPPDSGPAADIGNGHESAPPAKKAKPQNPSTTQTVTTTETEHLRSVDDQAIVVSPVKPVELRQPRERVIPAPGQTIWKRVLPPPKPRPAAQRDVESPYPITANPTPGRVAPPALRPPLVGTGVDAAVPATGDQSDVEIIDLTEQDDDVQATHREKPYEARPPPPIAEEPGAAVLSTATFTAPSRMPPIGSQPDPQAGPSSYSLPARKRPRESAQNPFVYRAEVEVTVNVDELQTAAVDFLQRYLRAFMEDRSTLASAYSRAASFSVQTVPAPSQQSLNAGESAVPPPPMRHSGRVDIIAALLDLPDDETLCTAAHANVAQPTVLWDFVHAQEAGDILLICYATPNAASDSTSRHKDKGKGKATAAPGSSSSPHASCEQRFILRPKEWDGEDRSTPGVWPLVAVAHQMLFRSMPS